MQRYFSQVYVDRFNSEDELDRLNAYEEDEDDVNIFCGRNFA